MIDTELGQLVDRVLAKHGIPKQFDVAGFLNDAQAHLTDERCDSKHYRLNSRWPMMDENDVAAWVLIARIVEGFEA